MGRGDADVDAYIDQFTPEIQDRLRAIRSLIKTIVPDASEAIKYGMPTSVYYGNLVHYAAYAHHVGFYPIPSAVSAFKDELQGYRQGKGSIQFPHDAPLPMTLIERMVRFRVEENLAQHLRRKP